jgi:hypothetical protein
MRHTKWGPVVHNMVGVGCISKIFRCIFEQFHKSLLGILP